MSLCGFNHRRKIEQETANIENKKIEDMSFQELKKFAKSKSINTYRMKQEDIIEALQTLETEGVNYD